MYNLSQISTIIQFHILAFKYTNIKKVVHITILGYAVSGDFIAKQYFSVISQSKYWKLVPEFLCTSYLELYVVKYFHNYVGQGQYLRFMCIVPLLSLSDTIQADISRTTLSSTDLKTIVFWFGNRLKVWKKLTVPLKIIIFC